MNININGIKDREFLTKEIILSNISDIDIYRTYLNSEVKFGIQSSPFRVDKSPSFGFFVKNNEILFNDYVKGGGDCIKFVQKLFNLGYYQALSKIAVDFNFDENYYIKNIHVKNKPIFYDKSRDDILKEKKDFVLHKKSRKWLLRDKKYWYDNYFITKNLLLKYNVNPISYFFMNGKPIKSEFYSYCFTEYKDGYETYKIYQPYSKKLKWITNHNQSIWQGWSQLPNKNDLLIITKSLKDVMVLNVLGYNSVALQAESIKPKSHIIEELKDRFKNIYLLYDNDFDKKDNPGRVLGNKISEIFKIKQIEIPSEYKSKDISDLVKNRSIDIAKYVIYKQLKN